MSDAPVCAVIGVGPGNGLAYARRFAAEGQRVALMSRSLDQLESWAGEIDGAKAFAVDATDPHAVEQALLSVESDMGTVETLIYNAGSGLFGSIDDADFEAFESAWRINTLGLAAAAKTVVPGMRAIGRGNILISGATASRKGGAKFAAFAQAKAAQRSLAQSLARHLGPDGIHVALIIIDAVVNIPRTRQMLSDKPDEFFAEPEAIADMAWYLANQHRSAWTFEIDLRPFGESW